MSLANVLEKAGFPPKDIKTQAHVTVEVGKEKVTITRSHLVTEGRVPGLKESDFQKHAEEVKKNLSRLEGARRRRDHAFGGATNG